MYKNLVLAGAAILLFLINPLAAEPTVWLVHPDSALNSIQAALDSCADNDIVLVCPGTYFENIVWPSTNGIHLISEQGPEMTIISGDSASNPDSGSVVCFVSGQDTNTVLRGFTITNGSGTNIPSSGTCGGGIYCYDYSSPTITGNIINGNTAVWGGGIECWVSCSPIITGNKFTYNTADSIGGGIHCSGNSSAFISGNTIENNSAGYIGGGVTCAYGSLSDVTGNIIRWNSADYCGGVECHYCSPNIIGNIITNNTAWCYGGGIRCYDASPIIKHNIITDNIAVFGYGGGGIRCQENSAPNIDSCIVLRNYGDGIYCRIGADPVIRYCDIVGNEGFAVCNVDPGIIISAEYNWWGDSTGPYHPDSNPGGLGDTVSDYVDFIPWLYWHDVEEQPVVSPVVKQNIISATIFRGPLQLPQDKACKVFDIAGREVKPHLLAPGIYFIEIDGAVTQKVIKIK